MENIIVAIVSHDREYNGVLAVALTNACRELTVKIFDNREFVRLWSDYDGPGAFYDNFDVVLWAGEEVCESYSDNIVYLCDKPSLAKKDFLNNKFCLYKFETVRVLLGSIFEIYAHLTGRNAICSGRTKVGIFGFCSSWGGTGCTTLAMAVAQELCRFHRKNVIYVSMEDVESTGGFVGAGGCRTSGEYLYRLLGQESFTTDIRVGEIPFPESFLLKNAFGVETFAPSRGKNPLRELKEKDMERFLLSLIQCGRYDSIIIDFSTCLTEAGIAAMEMTDRICFVSGPGRPSGREENYMAHLACCGGDNLIAKMIKTENMCDKEAVSDGELFGVAATDRAAATVRRLKGNNAQKGSDLLLEGGFGSDISRLTRLLLQ